MENRYVVYDNVVCVEDISLVNAGLITKDNLTQKKSRNNVKSKIRGGNGRTALTVFDDLPLDLQSKIIETFGIPPKIRFSKDYSTNKNY